MPTNIRPSICCQLHLTCWAGFSTEILTGYFSLQIPNFPGEDTPNPTNTSDQCLLDLGKNLHPHLHVTSASWTWAKICTPSNSIYYPHLSIITCALGFLACVVELLMEAFCTLVIVDQFYSLLIFVPCTMC